MTVQPLNVGIAGLGVVGAALARLLSRGAGEFSASAGRDIRNRRL